MSAAPGTGPSSPARVPTTSTWQKRQEVEVVVESVTITDNRSGQAIEIPIVDGGISAEEWSKLLPGSGSTTPPS